MRHDRDTTAAVSSVVGTALMLGVTMVTFAGFGLVAVAYFSDPGSERHSDLTATPGDEAYLLQNVGGDAVPVSGTKLFVNVGGVEQSIDLADLEGDGLPDGATQWTVGETLCLSCHFGNVSEVKGAVVVSGDAVIAAQGERGKSCTDTTAPTVSSWTQSPSDVKSTSSGAVTVTAVLTDDCAGVSTRVLPTLHYRIRPRDASYTSLAMAFTGTDTVQATIPSQTWGALSTQVLEYYMTGQADGVNNRQADVVNGLRSDAIELDCTSDTAAPVVSSWTRSPTNIDVGTTGAVTVTAVLVDGCSGVDQTAAVKLAYSIDSGTPSYTSVSMTRTATSTWQGQVPSQTWSAQLGKTVRYYVWGQKDLGGRTQANTPNDLQTDTVEGTEDPGQPYLDANGNGIYDAGDGLVTPGDVTDGSYSASGNLVIPDSTGPISATSITFTATGGSLTIGTSLTATGGSVSLTGTNVAVAEGVTVTASSSILLVNDAGTFTGSGATFVTPGTITIGSSASGHLGTVINLEDAHIDNSGGTADVLIQWESGDLAAAGLQVDTKGAITIGGTTGGHMAGDIDMAGADLDNTLGTSGITLQNIAGSISASGTATRFATKGAISITASSAIDVSGATLTNTGGTSGVTLTAGTTLTATSASIASKGAVSMTSAGAFTATGLTATNTGGTSALTFQSTGSSLSMANANVDTRGQLQVLASGALSATTADFDNSLATATLTLQSSAGAVDLTGTGVHSKGTTQALAASGLTLTSGTFDNSGGTASLTLTTTSGTLACAPCTAKAGTTLTASGAAVTMTGATLRTSGTGNALSVTATGGALSAAKVSAITTGSQTWKASGAGYGISLDGSSGSYAALSASSGTIQACVRNNSGGTQGQVTIGTTSTASSTFTDTNSKLSVRQGASGSECASSGASATYVANYSAVSSKVE